MLLQRLNAFQNLGAVAIGESTWMVLPWHLHHHRPRIFLWQLKPGQLFVRKERRQPPHPVLRGDQF
jgi:hypothetical protein